VNLLRESENVNPFGNSEKPSNVAGCPLEGKPAAAYGDLGHLLRPLQLARVDREKEAKTRPGAYRTCAASYGFRSALL